MFNGVESFLEMEEKHNRFFIYVEAYFFLKLNLPSLKDLVNRLVKISRLAGDIIFIKMLQILSSP